MHAARSYHLQSRTQLYSPRSVPDGSESMPQRAASPSRGRAIIALGRQQAFPLFGLSKSSREAMRVHALGGLSTARPPASDIVAANVEAIASLSSARKLKSLDRSEYHARTCRDLYASLVPPSADRPPVWHGVWQTPSTILPSAISPSRGSTSGAASPSPSPRTSTRSPSPARSPFATPSQLRSKLSSPSTSPSAARPPLSPQTQVSLRRHVSRVQTEFKTTYHRIQQEHRDRPVSPLRSASPPRLCASPPPPLSPRPRSAAAKDKDGIPTLVLTKEASARMNHVATMNNTMSPPEGVRLVQPSPFRLYTERSGQRLLWPP